MCVFSRNTCLNCLGSQSQREVFFVTIGIMYCLLVFSFLPFLSFFLYFFSKFLLNKFVCLELFVMFIFVGLIELYVGSIGGPLSPI